MDRANLFTIQQQASRLLPRRRHHCQSLLIKQRCKWVATGFSDGRNALTSFNVVPKCANRRAWYHLGGLWVKWHGNATIRQCGASRDG